MTSQLKVLEIIEQHAPRPHTAHPNNPRSAYVMKCPLCNYDSRHGVNNYFTVSADQQLWSCHVCGAHGNAWQLQKLLTDGHTYQPPENLPPLAPRKSGAPQVDGATIQSLALAKGLDPDWLRATLGWSDGSYYSTPAVRIPYFDQDHQECLIRHRVGITGERFRWDAFKQGQEQIPYGLWTLPNIKRHGWVLVVEGETDFATCLYNGIPAIGVPGARAWKKQWGEYFNDIKVYVWQEPDLGGETLIKSVSQTLSVWAVTPPTGATKDVNELYQQVGADFPHELRRLLSSAIPLVPPVPENDNENIWIRKQVRERDQIFSEDVHLGPYNQVKTLGTQVDILRENPSHFLDRGTLLDWLRSPLISVPDALLYRIEDCGLPVANTCPDHGEQSRTMKSCKSNLHAGCLTRAAYKRSKVKLPDLIGGAVYREVWIVGMVPLIIGDYYDWAEEIKFRSSIWVDAVKRIGRQKAWKGRFLQRAMSFFMDNTSRLTYKVMIREDFNGEADEIVQDLEASVSGDYTMEKAYTLGREAMVQLVEDDTVALAGATHETYLAAFFYGTHRQRTCQPLGELYHKDREIPVEVPEPLVCPVLGCGKPLFARMLRPKYLLEPFEPEATGTDRRWAEPPGKDQLAF